jgi:ribosomal protein S30
MGNHLPLSSISTGYYCSGFLTARHAVVAGKVHGSLARAGKVRGQTPKVAKQDKKKQPRGRAHKRIQYNRRFVTAVVGFGKKRGPNSSEK